MTRRHGIWKCPNCSKHQVWKIRSLSTTKLDRKCKECETRVRVTLDRSSTGQGRKESVEIWERSTKLSDDELNREVEVRDSQDEMHTINENIVRGEVHIQSGLSQIYADKCYCLGVHVRIHAVSSALSSPCSVGLATWYNLWLCQLGVSAS